MDIVADFIFLGPKITLKISFLGGTVVKNLLTNAGDGFDPWVGKTPWRRERLPTPVFWPGEFHGLYSLWGHRVGQDLATFNFTHN